MMNRQPLIRLDYSPYLAIWAAVLVQAIRDCDDPKKNEREAAREWFFNDEQDGVGSLRWICSHLDISAEHLRWLCNSRENRRRVAGHHHKHSIKE